MEQMKTKDLAKLCRLCLKKGGYMKPIFGIEGVHRGLSHKISVCFPFEVYETDPLPKLICHKCIFKLEDTYHFRSVVYNAFESVKKALLRTKDKSIHTYFNKNKEEPVGVINTIKLQNGLLQRNNPQTSNYFSEQEEEEAQITKSRTLKKADIQITQTTELGIRDPECKSPQNKTVDSRCKNLDAPNCLSFGETSTRDLHNNESGTTSEAENIENAIEESDVITQTLFDESFTRDLCNNATVIVSREKNIGNVSDELDVSSGLLFNKLEAINSEHPSPARVSQEENVGNVNDELDAGRDSRLDEISPQGQHYDECTNVSQENQPKEEYQEIDFESYNHDQQINKPETVVQIGTPGFNIEQPAPDRLNGGGEGFMNDSNTHRSENDPGTSNGINHQTEAMSPNSASLITNGETYYWCNSCLKYLNKKLFKNHKIKVHSWRRAPTNNCICKRKFYTFFDLLTHKKSHLRVQANVKDQDLLKCGICHKRFYDSSIFSSHLSSHEKK